MWGHMGSLLLRTDNWWLLPNSGDHRLSWKKNQNASNHPPSPQIEMLQILPRCFFFHFSIYCQSEDSSWGHNKMIQGLFMPLFSDYCSQSRIRFMLFQHRTTQLLSCIPKRVLNTWFGIHRASSVSTQIPFPNDPPSTFPSTSHLKENVTQLLRKRNISIPLLQLPSFFMQYSLQKVNTVLLHVPFQGIFFWFK